MVDLKKAGKNIAALRTRKGMTQQALAAAMDVSHQAVSKWENGQALPDMATMLKLAKLFGVTIEGILTGDMSNDEDRPSFGKWFMDIINSKPDETRAAEEDDNTDMDNEDMPQDDEDDDADVTVELYNMDEDGNFTDEITDDNLFEEEPQEEPEVKQSKVDLNRLVAIAPFMSKEALNDIVAKCEAVNDWNVIVKLAPFLSREAITQLVTKCSQSSADKNVIVKLAPFLGADNLAELISKNTDQLDWDTINKVAPFLRREYVDKLAAYFAEMPEDNKANSPQNVIEDIFNGVGNAIGETVNTISRTIQKTYTEIAQTIDKSQKKAAPEEKKEASPAKLEAMKKIAEKAIEEENTQWLSKKLGYIQDEAMLYNIAKLFIDEDEYEDEVIYIAQKLDEEQVDGLARYMIDEESDMLTAILPYCSKEISIDLIKKAVEDEDSETVEKLVSMVVAVTLNDCLQTAIENSDWDTIDIITEALD